MNTAPLLCCLGAFAILPILAMFGRGARRHYVALILLGGIALVLGLLLSTSAKIRQAAAEASIIASARNSPRIKAVEVQQREAASLRTKMETRDAMGLLSRKDKAKAQKMLADIDDEVNKAMSIARQHALEEARQAVEGTADAPESYPQVARWCDFVFWLGLSAATGALLGVVLVRPKTQHS